MKMFRFFAFFLILTAFFCVTGAEAQSAKNTIVRGSYTNSQFTFESTGKGRVAFLGEFGGLGWRVDGHLWNPDAKNWGYDGDAGKDKTPAYLAKMAILEDFAARGLAGSVYTQTTDVEIEINGIITYDRKVVKYDPAVLRAAHGKVMRAAGAGSAACR